MMTGPAFFFVCLIAWFFVLVFWLGVGAGSTDLTLDLVHCTEESVVPWKKGAKPRKRMLTSHDKKVHKTSAFCATLLIMGAKEIFVNPFVKWVLFKARGHLPTESLIELRGQAVG